MKYTYIFGGVGRALSVKNFRIYWVGNLISILGFWVHKLALGWLTWELTYSPFWLGAIGFATLFPPFVLSPFTGAVADRFGMRRIAYYALGLSFCSASLLGFLVSFDLVTINLLFLISCLQGTALAFDLPARQGLVNLLIERADLSSAIAINTTTFHIGGFVGPAIFALVVRYLELEWAFFLNAATFLFFLYSLRLLKIEDVKKDLSEGLLKDILDGVHYLLGHAGIQSLFLLSLVPHFLIRPFIDLLPGFSVEIFDRGTDGVAILAGAYGLGALLVGFVLALRGKVSGLTRINIFAIILATVSMFGFSTTAIFWFGVVCIFGVGMALIAFAVANQSLIQYAVEPEKRGRIISLSTGLALGLPAFGSLLLGYLGNIFGIQLPVAVSMVVGLFICLWASRRLLRYASLLEMG